MNKNRFARVLIVALLVLGCSAASFAGVFVSVSVAPPPLPVYVQPVCPGPGYIWTPGYWAWSDDGYYWVPGTWVPAPAPGLLWTPGYWGWVDGGYRWNAGYWGPHVGFYGGVNYGFGYHGVGFVGGEWRGGNFFYNSAVMNVRGAHITNVYVNKTVIVNRTTINNVSYNGGRGGINRGPSGYEMQAARERHFEATREQSQHENFSARNPQLFAKNNGGRPAIAATARPGDFSRNSAVAARAAGGHVDAASLHASARNMPPAAGHGDARAPQNAGGAHAPVMDTRAPHGGNEVHRPPEHAASVGHSPEPGGRNVPRPPNGNNMKPSAGTERMDARRPEARNNMPRNYEARGGEPRGAEQRGGEMRGGEQRGGNGHQPAQAPHVQSQPQHQAAQHGAPQQHEGRNEHEHKH